MPDADFYRSQSPRFFHGLHSFEPWLNGKSLDGCVFLDEETGLARTEIKDDDGATVVQKLRGVAELHPRRKLRLVRS
ncbi:hypothetical protein [Bosea vaviloviae]|uniref:Uncharacterized protein n=1 Tax=Bosea vaviloviae TaxID=1526658 RepID=A0A1D7U2R9_9HYPH|nr:hypothetical protein [Bosea vaviloviae]AOO81669.1 hypothetical protein BHK69_15480 [Bosea vaviloviae]